MIITIRPGQSRRRVHAVIDALDDTKAWDMAVTEHKSQRSVAQNRLMWAWHGHLQRHLGESGAGWFPTDDIHEFIVSALLPPRVITIGGDTRRVRASTRRLKVAEMTDFLNRYEEMARDRWGLQFPHPEDLYYEAMRQEIKPC